MLSYGMVSAVLFMIRRNLEILFFFEDPRKIICSNFINEKTEAQRREGSAHISELVQRPFLAFCSLPALAGYMF